MKRTLFSTLALFLVAGLAMAGDIKSGPDLGESTSPFLVKDITGPHQGTSLCYRCAYGARPVTCIFTREVTPEVASLVQTIDGTVASNKDKNMCAFVVLLTEDADGGAKQLAKLAADKNIKNIPLTVFDGRAGPEAYKISKDAAVTVLMWNKSRVEVSHAFAAGKLSDGDVKTIASDTSKILK